MPWKERNRMSLRSEFVQLASCEGVNFAELCRRYGITRKTGYKWRRRYKENGFVDLADRSRRPYSSPWRTDSRTECAVLKIRREHPTWGGRKIRARMLMLGHSDVPAASTITAILHRHGCINPEESKKRHAMRRFERKHPNELWQMDFKGHFALGLGGRCHPLTVLDDHSRYSIGILACKNQQYQTVRGCLTNLFKYYGLPNEMLMDNGSPWGVSHGKGGGYTRLTAWLLRLGIRTSHGRPYHPQTQGKEERFHRTFKQELLREKWYRTLCDAQRDFDPWRYMYNHERPHEALDMAVPASRYLPSDRAMPEKLMPMRYGPEVHVRRVNPVGQVQFKSRVLKVSEAFQEGHIGLRPCNVDGMYHVMWSNFVIGVADIRKCKRGKQAVVRLRSLRSLHRTTTTPEEAILP